MQTTVGIYSAHHHCFHIDGLTDISPTRTQAERRRRDTRGPESTVIHFHPKSTPCFGSDHEGYRVGSLEIIRTNPVQSEVM